MSAHERERLSAWLDGELAPAERAEVEAHLSACPECAALLAELGAVDEAARELPLEAPPGYFESFSGRVRARIEAERPARAPAPPARWRIPVWTWAAAAVLLLAVVTPLTLERLDREEGAAMLDQRARAPREVPVEPAPASRERPAAAAAPEPPESLLPRAPASPAERDEATGAGRAREPEARAKREEEPGRRLDDRESAPPAAYAAAPAPAAPPAVEGRPRERGPGASTLGVESLSVVEREAVAEALEEAPAPAPGPRRQAAVRDVAAQAAAADAPEAAGVPAKGRMAAPQAAQGPGVLALEKKSLEGEDQAYSRLAGDGPEGAAEWREHREAWRAFVAAYPGSPHADEARVRVIEAGLEAWRAGGDPGDLEEARADAESYLERDDAGQKGRVRRALDAAALP